ncbi:sulfite exporter TauE/SafE family protein [Nitrosophilus kaiyonis]|uniref:sulfite exporter TauE/SafE family protein n=1 Tax=Nitrosophilus kaiyonis TaxID=2930200 RepID=UPI002490BA89|nr:sulfite exporter TauE/SafE family protein [Nitrosophilus kaiyonis]
MIFELSIVGILVGFLSGFFGIGGGTILVPLLMLLGIDIKEAVGISVTQMVFSSLFGSYLNFKKNIFKIHEGFSLGVGGFIGALGSGYFVSIVNSKILEYMFLGFILFAFYRFFKKNIEENSEKDIPKIVIFFVGIFIGLFAISIGVGGSILVTPILVGLFHFDIKKAASMGLFFVIFSSISGFISLSFFGHINYLYGLIVGTSSLIGVYFGIKLAHKTDRKKFRNLLVVMYSIILILVIKKIFLS